MLRTSPQILPYTAGRSLSLVAFEYVLTNWAELTFHDCAAAVVQMMALWVVMTSRILGFS
jgi:hypothetical protein